VRIPIGGREVNDRDSRFGVQRASGIHGNPADAIENAISNFLCDEAERRRLDQREFKI
jgi:hypothetical protein